MTESAQRGEDPSGHRRGDQNKIDRLQRCLRGERSYGNSKVERGAKAGCPLTDTV